MPAKPIRLPIIEIADGLVGMTTEQVGATTLLILAMVRHGGSIPNDDRALARIAGLSPARWAKVGQPVCALLVEAEGGRLTHPSVIAQMQRDAAVSTSNRKSARSRYDSNPLESNNVLHAFAERTQSERMNLHQSIHTAPPNPLESNNVLHAFAVQTQTRAPAHVVDTSLPSFHSGRGEGDSSLRSESCIESSLRSDSIDHSHRKANDADPARDLLGAVAPSQSRSRKADKLAARKALAETAFDVFWSVYPRRAAKQAARKAWDRLVVAEGVDPDLILEGARRYQQQRAGAEIEFTAHPSTWLNQRRYEDEAPPTTTGGNRGAGRRFSIAEDFDKHFMAGFTRGSLRLDPRGSELEEDPDDPPAPDWSGATLDLDPN